MYFGFEGMTISYGQHVVIEDVTVAFEKGRTTTLIGANGCGKTSLLKTISRAVRPDRGHVIYDGKPLSAYSSKTLAKKIAYLPQVHSSPEDIDVKTLVSHGRYPYKQFGRGLSKTDREIVDDTLQLTGLKALEHRMVQTLSGGERQRAWIAMTICQQPEVLVLDEPITYLDIGYQLEVMELIRTLDQTLHLTIVMVLHDINLAARYSHYLYAIKDKGIHFCGCPRETVTHANMKEVFGINAQILNDVKNDCPFVIPEKNICI